ncbi:hypothetical protein GOODEAATRI_006919 [Goodea atripinnis]|uniref:OCEL domain-containing protein n=1 Tax=Goodea atripinnis TaxID=208336 RepID=A0ABV0MZA2_9TELE
MSPSMKRSTQQEEKRAMNLTWKNGRDAQRHEYKREFDADLREYKRLCAEMDDVNDRLNKLSRQLDTLDESSAKYQV